MGQEFIIKSPDLEDKINQLLPSQGGFQAGVDLSASTQIIPIVDLTETAEGSNVRADLQTALSLTAVTSFSVTNATTTLVNTTGYYRIFGNVSSTDVVAARLELTDGSTTKRLLEYNYTTGGTSIFESYDFVVYLRAGEEIRAVSGSTASILFGTTRQIADIDGNLVNP